MHRADVRRTRWELMGCLVVVATGCLLGGCNLQPIAEVPTGLAAQQRRSAFQSQCAQIVIACTSSWPTPSIDIEALNGQTVTPGAAGFVVEGSEAGGAVLVQLIGSGSDAGSESDVLTFSWSAAATDADPCTVVAGAEFSTETDPQIELQPGFHYIRLTVMNDIIRDAVPIVACDTILGNVASFDFVEVEIEVR